MPTPVVPPLTPHRRRLLAWSLLPLLLLGAAAVGEWAQWPFLRGPLERVLSRATDRAVQLGAPFGVRLLGSIRLHTAQLSIGPPTNPSNAAPSLHDAQGRPRELLRAEGAVLVLPYLTLARLVAGDSGPLDITRLVVDRFELNLARDARGRANWHLGAPAASSEAPAPAAATPHFQLLLVRQGLIRLDDAPLRLQLAADVRTREGSASDPASGEATAAGLDVQARGTHQNLPLTASLQSSGLLPLVRSDGERADKVPIKAELRLGRSRLSLQGHGADLVRFGALQGTFVLSGPSLAAVGDIVGVTLPTTAAFTMHGEVGKRGKTWSADVRALEIGSSRLRGEFRFDTAPAVPRLSGTLAGARLALIDLGPAFGGRAPGAPPEPRNDRVLPQREFDIPSLRAMDADVRVQLDLLDLGTGLLEPLQPLSALVRLQDGVLGVRDLVARTSEGELRGALTVSARTATPLWTADLRWSGIQLERFVKARNPRSREAPGYVSGELGGAARLQGSGRSTAQVLGSLEGQTHAWVRAGRLSQLAVEAAGIDIAESLGLLISGDRSLPMRCAVAQLSVRGGRARPDLAVIDTTDTTLLASGELSFADESLALVLTAHPHDFTPVSLRSPVRVSGSFAAPVVRLDKRSMGLRLAGAVALSTVSPLAALLPLFDFGEEDQRVCREAMAQLHARSPRAR